MSVQSGQPRDYIEPTDKTLHPEVFRWRISLFPYVNQGSLTISTLAVETFSHTPSQLNLTQLKVQEYKNRFLHIPQPPTVLNGKDGTCHFKTWSSTNLVMLRWSSSRKHPLNCSGHFLEFSYNQQQTYQGRGYVLSRGLVSKRSTVRISK